MNVNENLNDDFYINSIEYCQKNIENFHLIYLQMILSGLKTTKIFNSANNIYGSSSHMESLLIDVAKMLNYENFIVEIVVFLNSRCVIRSGIQKFLCRSMV